MTADTHPELGNLIRKRRKQLGFTLQVACAKADLSVGYLSQLERGNATPSLGTLSKVAHALDVGIEYFVKTLHATDALTRAESRFKFSFDDTLMDYEAVSTEIPGGELSSYIINVPAGSSTEIINHDGEEIIMVLEGEIVHSLDDEYFQMKTGDSLHYRGNRFHSLANKSSEPARIIWTCTPPLFHRRGNVVQRAAPSGNENTKLKTNRES